MTERETRAYLEPSVAVWGLGLGSVSVVLRGASDAI